MRQYADPELNRLSEKHRLRNVVNLSDAAELCLLTEDRLKELARDGFAPHILIDGKNYWFNIKDICTWAKENLYLHCPGSTLPKVMAIKDHAKADPYGIPEMLIPIAGQLKEIHGDPFGPCVYFLIENNEVVYIGQSRNLSSRLETHKQNKKFSRSLYLPCPTENLNEVESSLIRRFRPKYNTSQVNCLLTSFHITSLNKIGLGEYSEETENRQSN